MKVYCKDCKYYERYLLKCGHPENKQDNYEGANNHYILSAWIRNAKNNCELFTAKWLKRKKYGYMKIIII